MVQNLNILVVDDDPHLAKTLSDILRLKGYSPFIADHGKLALEKLEEVSPAVVLIDLKLPDMDGLKVMGGIKKRSPHTECIVLTGHASQTSAIKAVNMGAFSYVQKPYDIEHLIITIKRVLEKRKAALALQDSEARYRMLFNSGNDAVIVYRLQNGNRIGRFIEVNDVACKKLGYSREELLQYSFHDIEIRQNARKLPGILENLSVEKHVLYETSLVAKSQNIIPVEINAHLFNFKGYPTVLACARDITERKRTEKINDAFSVLGYTLNSVTTPKQAAEVILNTADELFGWDACHVFVYSQEDNKFYPIVAYDTFAEGRKKVSFDIWERRSDLEIAKVLTEGPRLILRKDQDKKRQSSLVPFGDTTRMSSSIMIVPIKKREKNIGTLSIQSYTPNYYSSSDLELLKVLADHCSGALDRSFTEAKLRQKEFFTNRLSELGKNLSAATKPKDAAMLILDTADEIFGWDSCFLSFYSHEEDRAYDLVLIDMVDGKRKEFPPVDEDRSLEHRIKQAMHIGARLILRENPESVDQDIHKLLTPYGDRAKRCSSLMFMPIRKGEVIIGLLSVQSYKENAYTNDDLETLQILADYCGGALERIFTETKLLESEQRLRLLTEQIPSLLWTTDKNLCFTLMLGARLNTIKLKPERLLGKSLYEFFGIKDPDFLPIANHTRALNGESATFEMELKGKFFHSYVEPLRDKEGNIIGCISVSSDITERKKAEEELKLAHEIYPKAIENTKGVPYSLNLVSGKYKFIGEGWEELLGIPRKAMTHNKLKRLVKEIVVRGADGPIPPEEYGKQFREGRLDRYRADLRIVTSQGEEKWLSDCAVPLRHEKTNKVIGSLGIIQDITERKQMEKLYESFAALGRKLGTVTNPKEAGKVILDTADELFGWDASYLAIYEEDKDELYPVIFIDRINGHHKEVAGTGNLSPPTPMARRTLAQGAQLIQDRFSSLDDYGLITFGNHKKLCASHMFCPIRKGNKNIGILTIQSYTPNTYDSESIKLFQFLADHCSGALERVLAEEKLFQSEEQLRLLTQQIPSLLWTTDQELKFRLVLGAALNVLDLDPDQLVGSTLYDFFETQNPDFLPIALHLEALEGKSANYDMELLDKHFHAYIEPLRDPKRNIIGCICVAHDITDRVHSEEALRKAHEELEKRVEERTRELTLSNALLKREINERKRAEQNLENSLSLLRATLESTTDGILVVNNEGHVLNFNQRYIQMWNLTKSVLKKRAYKSLEKFCLRKLKNTPDFQNKVKELASQPDANSFDIVELKDGRIFERYSMPQRLGNKTVGRVWSFRDVTKSKHAEEVLARSEAIYREAIENAAGVPYRLVYKDNNYDFVGEGIESLLGYSSEDFCFPILKKSIKQIVIADPDAPQDVQEYIRAFKRGEVDQYRVDLRLITRSGEEKWVSDSSVPIHDEKTGKIVGSLGILQDVTKRKRMEEQARRQQEQLVQTEKMVALGILVSGVAHEINNPNNFIMLNIPTLDDAWKSMKPILDDYYEQNGDFLVGGVYYSQMQQHIPELLNCILSGATRIKNIVKELRDFARESRAGQMETVDINAIVKSSLTLLENMIKKSTNHFSVEYDEKIPKIQGNFQRLEQVVINLIQNACQALTSKDQKISVSSMYKPNKKRIILKIVDQGRGIPPEIQRYIMDPFFTTKRESGGVGLGLSISTKIINEHQGNLSLSSTPGKMTVATIDLPLSNSHDHPEGEK